MQYDKKLGKKVVDIEGMFTLVTIRTTSDHKDHKWPFRIIGSLKDTIVGLEPWWQEIHITFCKALVTKHNVKRTVTFVLCWYNLFEWPRRNIRVTIKYYLFQEMKNSMSLSSHLFPCKVNLIINDMVCNVVRIALDFHLFFNHLKKEAMVTALGH